MGKTNLFLLCCLSPSSPLLSSAAISSSLAMSVSIFLLWLVSVPFAIIHGVPDSRGVSINCGASEEATLDGIRWIIDEGYINVGSKTTLKTPDLMPTLATLRFFSDKSAAKYCYEIPVIMGEKYMVRSTYYYGGFDGGKTPPVFDQIIEGTKWSTVNTTEDFAAGLSSYYEIIVQAVGGSLSICLARNDFTTSDPFISSLEIGSLNNAMYNSTDFSQHALTSVARHSFGYNSSLVRFPDDEFNRYWHPFTDNNPIVTSKSNVSSTKFWNLPPSKVFETGLTTSRGKTLEVQWPAVALPSGVYYISLYFQDNRSPSPYSYRVFDVFINGKMFYKDLNVSAAGVTVFSTKWPLSGMTKITLVPDDKAPVGPIINAGEILQLVPLGKITASRDAKAMEKIARNLKNPPSDWRGDPCLPRENSWTGVTCLVGKRVAVSALNLTGLGLCGELSPSINNLSALTSLLLGGNKLTGHIPDMSRLKGLATLHLEDNQFSGTIPPSLEKLRYLKELFIQNNKFEGPIPDSLKNKNGLNFRY